jgi:glycosyltransferase involved in cell wall biosynthesis
MVAARLFSGIADGLADGVWEPSGVPAIYRLLEGLAMRPDIELLTVFACKDAYDGRFAKGRRMTLDPIGGVIVLPWAPRPFLARLGLDGKLREISHFFRCLWLYYRFRPQVTYFTNANFAIAGIFARFGLGRVVLRFLGLHPEQKYLAESRGGLQRWLYHAPIDRAICSLDGSGGRAYLPLLLNPKTPIDVLLNGVDRHHVDPAVVAKVQAEHGLRERPVVAFIGRLESNKGCREFVSAALKLLNLRPGAVDIVVIGDGSLRPGLEKQISVAGMSDRVRFVGRVPHERVAVWLEIASIYVSINYFGSLSNANLEAISAGKCVIVLDRDSATHTDEETEEVLPLDSVIRIDRRNIEAELVEVLTNLVDAPELIARHSRRAREVAAGFLDWDQRVSQEIELIGT